MSNLRFFISILLFINLPIESFAQAENIITLTSEKLNESLLRQAQVSSYDSLVLGIKGSGKKSASRPSLRAFIPSSWKGLNLCVRVMSADGRYEAVNTFHVTSSSEFSGTVVRFPYVSAYAKHLRQLSADDVAVLVRNANCNTSKGDYTIAYWDTENSGPTDMLRLQIHSFDAEIVEVFPDPFDETPIICNKLGLESDTAFDTLCEIPRSELPKKGVAEIEIYRTKNRITGDPTVLRVQMDTL